MMKYLFIAFIAFFVLSILSITIYDKPLFELAFGENNKVANAVVLIVVVSAMVWIFIKLVSPIVLWIYYYFKK